MNNMSLLRLPLESFGTDLNNLFLSFPRFNKPEEYHEALSMFSVTDLTSWQAAEGQWRGPAGSLLHASSQPSAAAASSSAAVEVEPPFKAHAKFSSCWLIAVCCCAAFLARRSGAR